MIKTTLMHQGWKLQKLVNNYTGVRKIIRVIQYFESCCSIGRSLHLEHKNVKMSNITGHTKF